MFDEWVETFLWFKLGMNDPNPFEFKVLSHPNCSDEERKKLLEKNASQIVGMLQKLTGEKLIIQGQYRLVHKDEAPTKMLSN